MRSVLFRQTSASTGEIHGNFAAPTDVVAPNRITASAGGTVA
jgi:hypothetical protein